MRTGLGSPQPLQAHVVGQLSHWWVDILKVEVMLLFAGVGPARTGVVSNAIGQIIIGARLAAIDVA